MLSARLPLQAVLIDEDTSLVVRDANDDMYLIDLPRLVVVQRVPSPAATD